MTAKVIPFVRKLVLRDFQEAPISEFENDPSLAPIVQLPPGAGKNEMIVGIAEREVKRGGLVLVLVRGVILAHNVSKRFKKYKIPHGFIQGSNRTGLDQKIIVCSIDTLINIPMKDRPKATLVVIDEVHQAPAPEYARVLKAYDCRKFGLTATPYRKEGFLDIGFNVIKRPAAFMELVERGYLAWISIHKHKKMSLNPINSAFPDLLIRGQFAPATMLA